MAKLEAFRTYCSPDRPPLKVLYQITSDPVLNIPELRLETIKIARFQSWLSAWVVGDFISHSLHSVNA